MSDLLVPSSDQQVFQLNFFSFFTEQAISTEIHYMTTFSEDGNLFSLQIWRRFSTSRQKQGILTEEVGIV